MRSISSVRLWLPLLLLSCLLGPTGCPPPFGPGEPIDRPPPAEMIGRALRQRADLQTLRANAAMRIIDREAEFGLRVRAEILADRQGKLRIHATKALETIEAFHVMLLENDIVFYVPSQNVLYRGTLKDLEDVDIKLNPQSILRQLLSVEEGLRGMQWQLVRSDRRRRRMYSIFNYDLVVLEQGHERGKPFVRLVMQDRTYLLLAIEYVSSHGEVLFKKMLDRYMSLPPDGADPRTPATPEASQTRMFPFWMMMEWPKEQRSIEISFKAKEVTANPDIGDEDWDFSIKAGTQVQPIRKVRMEGDPDMDLSQTGPSEP